MIFKVIFSSQRFSVKTRRIYASIAGLLQVNSTQLALKIAARDRFIIQSSGYLIKFPQESEIKPHTDRVKAGKHFRLNIVLKPAKKGGEFICKDSIINTRRVKLFRPDINEHRVMKIEIGCRYILSIGWIKD